MMTIRMAREALRMKNTVSTNLYHKRLFVVLWLLQLCHEFGSNFIFLWPLNHHCKGPANLTLTDLDIRHKTLPIDVLHLLWVPSLDDPEAVAEAHIRGIHPDDIEQCYMYPIVNQTLIDYKKLTNCQFGLEFEPSKSSLSVVAEFDLACSRRWLRVLLPQSLGFGLFLGILLTWWPNRKLTTNSNGTNKSSLSSWCLKQFFALALIAISTSKLYSNKVSYVHLLAGVALRSFIIGSSFTRILTIWRLKPSLDIKERNQLAENQLYLFLFFSIYISFQVFHEPSIQHLINHWIQLNKWLSLSSCLLLTLVVLYELGARSNQLKESDKLGINSEPPTSTRAGSRIILQVLNDDSITFLNTGADTMRQSERAQHTPLPQASTTRICEFCLINEPPIYAVGSMNHQVGLCECDSDRSGAIRSEAALEVDDSSVGDIDTYRPTTVPLGAYCLPFEAKQSITSSSMQSQTWSQSFVSPPASDPVAHTGAFHQYLFNDRLLLFKLWLLAFTLTFNYFLFRLLPDHKLLHPESHASLEKRKEENLRAHPKALNVSFSGDHQYLYSGLKNGTTEKPIETVVWDNNIDSRNETNSSQLSFDYNSVNFNTKTLGLLQNSYNPFMIIWATIEINIWPIELAVLLLHINRLSNFGERYFMLKYLFTLVKFGARLLVLEWVFIGIIRSQNHLIELDWLLALVLTVARLAATLMLYNYFYTMVKLSRKLGSTRMMEFAPNALAITLALCFASMAPIWEKYQLVIIPAALILNNSIVYLLSKQVSKRFQQSLCPMMFGDQN